MKQLLIAIAVLSLTACASKQPEPMVIPVQLLNYNPQVIIAADRPDSTDVLAIKADDSPESALDILLAYLKEVGAYVGVLEGQVNTLNNQTATFRANQTKVKQVILLNQQP